MYPTLRIVTVVFFVAILSAEIGAETQEVWMPDLRGIPLGKKGEVVAEFSVASSPKDEQVT